MFQNQTHNLVCRPTAESASYQRYPSENALSIGHPNHVSMSVRRFGYKQDIYWTSSFQYPTTDALHMDLFQISYHRGPKVIPHDLTHT